MSNNRLNSRDRLYIRIAKNGIAIANSALWRRNKPKKQEGYWKDITSCVMGCCGAAEPIVSNFTIFQNTTASANITDISYPGYSWSGTLANGDLLVVPLPYNIDETISVTVDTPSGRTITSTTVQGTGVIGSPGAITLATNTFDAAGTPESQYLVILS